MAQQGKALYVQIGQLECSLHSEETDEKPAMVDASDIQFFSEDMGTGGNLGLWSLRTTYVHDTCSPSLPK